MATRSPSLPVLLDVLDRAEQHQVALDQSPEGLLAAVKHMNTGLSEEALIQGIQDHLNPEHALAPVEAKASYAFGWNRPRTVAEQEIRLNEYRSCWWKRVAYWMTSDQDGDDNALGQMTSLVTGAFLAGFVSRPLAEALPGPGWVGVVSWLGMTALILWGEWRLYEKVCHGLHNRRYAVQEDTFIKPKEIKQLAKHASVRQYVRACLASEVPFIMNEDYTQIQTLLETATDAQRVRARRQQWAVSFAHDPSPCEQMALDRAD